MAALKRPAFGLVLAPLYFTRGMARAKPRVTVIFTGAGPQGASGEVAEVKAGYARNFLIPKKLAVYGTPAKLAEAAKNAQAKLLQEQQQKSSVSVDKSSQDSGLKRQLLITKMSAGITVTIARIVKEENTVFSSVSARHIANAVSQLTGVRVQPEHVVLRQPLKTLGSHHAVVKIPERPGFDDPPQSFTINVSLIAKTPKPKTAETTVTTNVTKEKEETAEEKVHREMLQVERETKRKQITDMIKKLSDNAEKGDLPEAIAQKIASTPAPTSSTPSPTPPSSPPSQASTTPKAKTPNAKTNRKDK